MSAPAKKEWIPRISIEDAMSCSIQWLSRARQKNVLSPSPPTLYVAYVVDDAPHLGFMHAYSSLFKYSAKDDPETDRARDCALRLLAIAVKAHYFLARDALCKHEPYFFSIPDVSQPSANHYGIVYKIESRPARTVICSTCDLGLVSALRPESFRFPVVLTKNSYRWFDKKHWASLAKDADLFERSMKPWIAKKEFDIAERWTNPADFPFGTLLDVPYEIKGYIKPTGAKWSDGLKKWYLPKGFDVEPVQEYVQWVVQQHRDNRENLEALHWRVAPSKKAPRSTRPADASPPASE